MKRRNTCNAVDTIKQGLLSIMLLKWFLTYQMNLRETKNCFFLYVYINFTRKQICVIVLESEAMWRLPGEVNCDCNIDLLHRSHNKDKKSIGKHFQTYVCELQ